MNKVSFQTARSKDAKIRIAAFMHAENNRNIDLYKMAKLYSTHPYVFYRLMVTHKVMYYILKRHSRDSQKQKYIWYIGSEKKYIFVYDNFESWFIDNHIINNSLEVKHWNSMNLEVSLKTRSK